jgi:hypothetical protein
MAKNPSCQWYWNDWVLDPALRLCSMAAQGFWMQMLAIAASATPYGYVRVGNKPCTITDLAHLTGQDKRSVSRWVRELQQNGVFSRDDLGVFCRRMVHHDSQEIRQKSRKKTQTPRARDSIPKTQTQESLCLDSKTPNRAPEHTPARTRARTQKNGNKSNGLSGEDWHEQYIDIGRKAAFDVERA